MEIKEWLNGGKEYATGLILLVKYSRNRNLIQHLSRKPWPEKLEYELRKICKEHESIVIPSLKEVVPPDKDRVRIGEKSKVNPDDLPEHLKQLWNETAEKYRLARAIHEQLKLQTKADQRAPLVEQLETYRKEIRANWDVIDSWVSERNQEVNTAVIDEKRINANRKYLSEGKKAVMSLSGASRAKKLEGMQRRINELLSAGEKFDPENQKELENLGMNFNG